MTIEPNTCCNTCFRPFSFWMTVDIIIVVMIPLIFAVPCHKVFLPEIWKFINFLKSDQWRSYSVLFLLQWETVYYEWVRYEWSFLGLRRRTSWKATEWVCRCVVAYWQRVAPRWADPHLQVTSLDRTLEFTQEKRGAHPVTRRQTAGVFVFPMTAQARRHCSPYPFIIVPSFSFLLLLLQ